MKKLIVVIALALAFAGCGTWFETTGVSVGVRGDAVWYYGMWDYPSYYWYWHGYPYYTPYYRVVPPRHTIHPPVIQYHRKYNPPPAVRPPVKGHNPPPHVRPNPSTPPRNEGRRESGNTRNERRR